MNGITHKQAQRYLRMDLDGLLTEAQRFDLETHLRACEACRSESQALSTLTRRLQTGFHARWDAQDGPSENVLTSIRDRSRRIMMQKRIDFAFNIFGGIITLLVLLFVISSVIAQFQKKVTSAYNGTQTTVPASSTETRLLAFSSEKDGNSEIYTVHADGSDLTNITNNPAHDANPFWSPDGKHIAFQSDRNGGYYSQIFLMDADGSNIIQLTTEKGEHLLPLNVDGKADPWSHDGSKLLFLRKGLSEADWILQAVDINSKDITSFATGRISFNDISWSPNGKYIGFVQNDPQNTDYNKFVSQFQAVKADGTNLININDLLPTGESPGYTYDWSRDGNSIVITASNIPSQGSYSFGSDSNPYYWKLYEIGLENRTLTLLATTRTPIGGWWQGSYFIKNYTSPAITWVSSEGKITTVNPTKDCKRIYNENTGSYMEGSTSSFGQSPNGNAVVGAYCPNGDMTLYWTNPEGTIFKPLLNLPAFAPANADGSFGQIPTNLTWSQDDAFIAFNMVLNNHIDMYILNVTESINNPSLPPARVAVGYSQLDLSPAWQPVIEDITEIQPTPEPEKAPTYDGLIAFTSGQDGNLDIYTMRADGSELTNLTNNSARDMDPVWSPHGKRIAFLSDRDGTGTLQIYSMNSDGTNLIRLTNIPDTEWWGSMDWSPDGEYLVAQHMPMESEQTTPGNGHINLYLIKTDGSSVTQLTANESGGDHSPKWSPNGDLIAFLHTESNLTQIYTVHPDGTGLFKVSQSDRNDAAFHWSLDGSRITYFSRPINCFPPDTCPRYEIRSVRADGTEPIAFLTLPDLTPPDATLDQVDWTPDRIAWSPDGRRLISVTWDSPPGSAGNSYLSILSPFNNSETIHKKLPGHIAEAHWSPDGLFFIYSSDVSGNWDIYSLRVTDVLQNLDAEPLQITSSPSVDTSPAWQPQP